MVLQFWEPKLDLAVPGSDWRMLQQAAMYPITEHLASHRYLAVSYHKQCFQVPLCGVSDEEISC